MHAVAVENKEGEGNSSRLYALARALTDDTKNASEFLVLSLLAVNKGCCNLNVQPEYFRHNKACLKVFKLNRSPGSC